MKKTIIYLLPALALLFASCVKEKMVACYSGLYLHYYYTLNPEDKNRFGSDINELAIFVFDSDGILYDYYLVDDPAQLGEDNCIYLPLPDGKWDIVTWSSEMKGFGYQSYGMGTVNPDTPEDPYNYGIIKGWTHIEEIRLWIKNHTDGGDGHRLVSGNLSRLYFGDVYGVETHTTPNPHPAIDVPLMQNTNTIRVVVNGLPQSRTTALTVTADMRNGRYTHDNQVGQHALPLYYRNGEWTTNGDGKRQMDLTILRPFVDDATSTLVVSSPLLADYGIADGTVSIPIIPTIMENPAYRTQTDLDRENLYIFEFTFTPNGNKLDFSVTINGWKVVYVIPGIS